MCHQLSVGAEADVVNSAVKLVERQRRPATHVHHHRIAVC